MSHLFNRAKLARLVSFTHRPKFSILEFSTETTAKCGGEQSPATECRRVELPKELSKNVIKLSCESTANGGVCDVYVVGTVHISEESSKQVEEIVKFLKPETVFLELCSSRKQVLVRENIKVPTVKEMIEVWKKKRNIFAILYSWFLAECGREVGVYPGAEFRSAYREVNKYGGKVVLGDRPVEITNKRTWRKLPLWHTLRLLIDPSSTPSSLSLPDSLSFSDLKTLLKKVNDIDTTQIKETVSKMLPTVMETIVHERDQYMSHTLLKVASESRSVVAVVGRGHLEGIKKNWKQPINIKDLITVPPPKQVAPAIKIFAYVSVVVAGVAKISSTYL